MTNPTGSFLLFAVLILASISWTGCDPVIDPPPPEVDPGTLSGVVREQGTGSPFQDLTVTLNTVLTTTDQNGRFEFREVPVGVKTLQVSETGFDDYLALIDVQTGENTFNVSLVRKTYFEYDLDAKNLYGLYAPAGVATYRGVIFLGPPGSLDSRGFASGIPRTENTAPGLNEFVATERQRSLPLAETYGLALMGADLNGFQGSELLTALEQFAEQSGHPELAQAPVLAMGFSSGGCTSYRLTLDHPERVIGFITQKGSCHSTEEAGLARLVPGYLVIGEDDAVITEVTITQLFEENRPQGALWALAIEPGTGHTPVGDQALLFNWMDAVLEARLPETPPPGEPVVLRPIDETTGWLGNRSSFEIADYAGFDGLRNQASWLPSMRTAQDWKGFVE